jgi:hypothetical protein
MNSLSDKNKIIGLLNEHLGPITPLDRETEAELIKRIVEVDYPNGKNVRAALRGLDVSDRQLRPYKDALILGHINEISGDDLINYIKDNAVIYPGAKLRIE